ncbi:hypothetical protein MKEN_01436100 [Mycena kentingensis (nom. inval.)]|nr:hypothetical protein MKEN_01436100 [Mycena kentingensis (nom. inval.)]
MACCSERTSTVTPSQSRLLPSTTMSNSFPDLHPSSSASWPCCPSTLPEDCTDQCRVVSCPEGNHCDVACVDDCRDADCTSFDDFLQCCTDFHSFYEEPRNHPESSVSWVWDPHLKTFVCSCDGDNNALTSIPDNEPRVDPNNVFFTPHQLTAMPDTLQNASIAPSVPLQASEMTCMWGNCGMVFQNLAQLSEHVSVMHLRNTPMPAVVPTPAAQDIFCQWKDCSIYPTANAIPGPSSGSMDSMLDVLSSHLLHDHLGFHVHPEKEHDHGDSHCQHSHIHSHPHLHHFEHIEHASPQVLSSPSTFSKTPVLSSPSSFTHTPALSSSEDEFPPSPTSTVTTSGTTCIWKDCGQTFPSLDDLTQHLTSVHVGSGKRSYDCYWGDCTRQADNGFSSKQKLCRHLQSHTGHRPFQCKVCMQHFSEAATLQQHMRRHTQEKPYVCDYPGCGKSFAITGALTIHKRVHNGEKPFQCPHCGKPFSESSNLSKHLRTHTGIKPYTCTEPGCNKSFTRADQLTRHGRVHRKTAS